MRSVLNSYHLQYRLRVFFFFASVLSVLSLSGQISHGGKPLPLHASIGARSIASDGGLFVEMPSFDAQAELLRSLEEQSRLKSLEFAHKFHPFLRPDNSGITFTSGNMQVWRVGIRSKGAYSINLLFSKFKLPPGAALFVYDSQQSEILGSYTEKNNSKHNMLPVQPIGGEELIVEYQEPINAPFKGEIEIGEVNHDYVGLFRATEPRDPGQNCHPNLVCYPEDIQPGSGVVALIINGTFYCTGVLVNNSAEDGTPYLLTATHCLNNNYYFNTGTNSSRWQKYGDRDNWLYDDVAGSIVAFFNYNSPLCEENIRGPIQMTMASADSVLISERHDMSLLKLQEQPPAEYQPYYLGWNANSGAYIDAPFHGLHHPNGGVKKVAIKEGRIKTGSFQLPNNYQAEPNSFWEIDAWDIAATEGGSSGSPLLDKNKRVVGTLTGGSSYCSSPRGPDSYASLSQFWDVTGSLGNPNSISHYLDPLGKAEHQLNGLNPYAQNPYTKSHNFKVNDIAETTEYQTVPLFATNNALGYVEFAEQFNTDSPVKLQGVFISSPATNNISNMNIRIRVYSGEEGPQQLLHTQPFSYNYKYFEGEDNFPVTPRDMRHSTENYIRFETPITVSGNFYISYSDAGNTPAGFSVFNAKPRTIGSGYVATAWMRNGNDWVKSSENMDNPVNTSLLIAPYVIGNMSTSVEPDKEDPQIQIYYSNEQKRIFIESNRELRKWEIFYSSGVRIHHETTDISMNRASYSSAHLPKGVYIVRVSTVDGTVSSKKILVM